MAMIIAVLRILLPTILLFVGIVIYILSRYRGFIEEDMISEFKLISPASKLLKNIVTKAFLSTEIMLILLTMYILSLTVAYAATFSYSSQYLEFQPEYRLLMVSKDFVPSEVIPKLYHYIIVYQIFKEFNLGNTSYYILAIKCSLPKSCIGNSTLMKEINRICTYVSGNYTVVDVSSSLNEEHVFNIFKTSLSLVRVDLSKLVDIELAPGIYFVHSIGVIGGLSLRIEDPSKILVIPMLNNILDMLHLQGSDVQTLVIGFDHVEDIQANIDKVLEVFDYIVVNSGEKAFIISRSFVPTSRTLLGLTLSFAISMIIIYAVSGGFVEKMLDMYRDLYILGIPKNLFKSAVILGLIITFSMASLPLVIASCLGYVNGIALLNYFVSFVGLAILTSNRIRGIIKSEYAETIGSYTYIVDTSAPLDTLINCIKDMLLRDDFFTITEIEGVREERFNVIRIELIYKKALSTIASVEIYIDRVDSNTRYNIVVDVWSLEDLSPLFLSSIQRLVLAKISGGLLICIES
jgi:hypothetical protein